MASNDTEVEDQVQAIDPENFRRDLALLARRTQSRQLGFPREWQPESVPHPESGMPFTVAGAWIFIAELLEKGQPMEVIEMRDKPGTRAFVMLVDMPDSERPLYVKVQLGSGKIIGRSFHWSNKDHGNKTEIGGKC